jgi:hypothetical protein
MVGHPAKRMSAAVVAFEAGCDDSTKRRTVGVVVKDRLAIVATQRDVI